ncbi:MAG: putative DNA binding domain-containing protein [Tagaea sp.]|nr:putative DNA binding domain-containing protein [Tagaea sp.]
MRAIVTRPESDRVERKESAKDRDKLRKSICALSNDLSGSGQPGHLLIGVKDDGTVLGADTDDKALLQLSGIRSEGKILPIPGIDLRVVEVEGKKVVVVVVQPASFPPVRLDGRIFVRVGPSTRGASDDEERRLIERRRWRNLPFDRQSAAPATLDDVDLRLFEEEYVTEAFDREVLARNGRTVKERLNALGFLAPDGAPNNGCMIVFGREPTPFVPGAYLQFVRFEGTELTDPVKTQSEIRGNLPAVLLRAEDILKANVALATQVTGALVETRRPDYPLDALRQLLANALMHRSYEGTAAPTRLYWFDDRIEIQSPGGPYGQVTAENFGKPGVTDYRNPLIAEAMKVFGFVQKFGIGIQVARQQMADNGNPEPTFEIGNAIGWTLRRAS